MSQEHLGLILKELAEAHFETSDAAALALGISRRKLFMIYNGEREISAHELAHYHNLIGKDFMRRTNGVLDERYTKESIAERVVDMIRVLFR